MFKKQLSVTLALALAVSLSLASGAVALNYTGRQGNQATFETLEETRASSPSAVATLETNNGRTFKSHPVLDGYPRGTTYVYRSANLFGGRAAARLNTNLLVFAEKSFASKEAALAYLKELGLIAIIDKAIGSVVLVTPADPKAGFGPADQKSYYALQTAMLAQKACEGTAKPATCYSDAEYFGGYGYLYVIGIDAGATFFNNYIASTFDYASRIAGALLINSRIDEIREVASPLPAFLVNAAEAVQAKYRAANGTDAVKGDAATTTYFNQALPLQQVVVSNDANIAAAAVIRKAYDEMFIRSMRIPVVKQGLYSAGTPFQGYGFDQAPYALVDRNPIVDGMTPDGISMVMHQEERFASLKNKAGEYLQTWFEYIPKEVLDKKVPNGTVPLVVANHGGGDDPRLYVDECGWLSLIGKERFIMVAAEKQGITDIVGDALAQLAAYMIKTYPAIDASRVYAAGYSMGGAATMALATGHPQLLAAATNMSGTYDIPAEYEAQFAKIDLPLMFTTSSYDNLRIDWNTGNFTEIPQVMLNKVLKFNEMGQITFDFAKYPMVGFKGDTWSRVTNQDGYDTYTWFLYKQGVPMVGVSYTKDLVHALYPDFAKTGWNYMKHFSRNLKTGEVVYSKYVK